MQWQFEVELKSDLAFPDVTAVQIYQVLSSAKIVVHSVVPDPFLAGGQPAHEFAYHIESALELAHLQLQINELLGQVTGIAHWKIQPGKEWTEAVVEQESSAEPQRRTDRQGHIRIGLDKVEQLVDLVGELIISKSQVDTLSHRLLRSGVGEQAARIDYDTAANQMDLVIAQLRDLSLSIRMVPLETLFSRFPGMVRDLARKQQKKIRLFLAGGNSEIDKLILETLADPLTHLIRNAADHGLEQPAERLALGKSEEGHILVEAYYEDDSIVVIIEDDGRGLDFERIRRKAVERGLRSESQAESMSDADAAELIFQPGFSTAASVTDLSGRGVGMDVVKTHVERINGSVSVDSQKGSGSRFTLKIPLTLSIVDSLLIQDQGQIFALPLVSIGRVSRIDRKDVQSVGEHAIANLGSYSIPAFPLGALFRDQTVSKSRELFVVETANQEGRFGILAETILGQQEIVIKSLGDYLGQVPGISGGTILGNGLVALIVDLKTCRAHLKSSGLKEAV